MRARYWLILIIILAGGGLLVFNFSHQAKPLAPIVTPPTKLGAIHSVIGKSVQGRKIEAYAYGTGKTLLTFVGGIHGGYEWNSVLLAYKFMDYLDANPKAIPANLTVTIIPDANPDGVYKIIGKEGRFALTDVPSTVDSSPGRFNAHGVDLNRNFDCQWQATSMWKSKTVSAGTAPFSEPEAQAIRDFALNNKPAAMIFWHSQAGAVYASQCGQGILPGTLAIMNAYAKAGGYPAVKSFDAYVTTGAADDWLASIGTPAITVELKTHATIEWEQNLAGIKALFNYYTQAPTLTTKYITPVDWPPQTQTLNQPLTCQTAERLIGSRTYCVTVTSEGAAGSIYNQYAYAFASGNQTKIITFTLRLVQCANYPDPDQSTCLAERASFNPDSIVEKI